jgi:DNA-directed RNA polymerase subunit H (RpoH/RPB5)
MSNLNVYPQVVDTIQNDFIRYRGLEIPDPVDITRISKILDQTEYIRINAVRNKPRGQRAHVIILVLDESKKYCHNSPELKKLMEFIDNDPVSKNKTLDEVILVVDSSFKNKKNLMEVVKMYQEREVRGPDLAGSEVFYTVIDNISVRMAIPEHEIVPKHELMTPEETQDFLNFQLKTMRDFPTVPHTDPQIMWIGGRPGQMVRITRPSEATTISIAYRTITYGT